MGVFNIHGKWTKINNLNKSLLDLQHPLPQACGFVITVIKYVCVSDKTDII